MSEASLFDDFMFSGGFGVMFGLIILVIAGILIYALVNFLRNATAEEVTIMAVLVDKNQNNHYNGETNSVTYTLTFEDTSGQRIVLDVNHRNYSQFIVGDSGRLTYQRKWLKNFERIN